MVYLKKNPGPQLCGRLACTPYLAFSFSSFWNVATWWDNPPNTTITLAVVIRFKPLCAGSSQLVFRVWAVKFCWGKLGLGNLIFGYLICVIIHFKSCQPVSNK